MSTALTTASQIPGYEMLTPREQAFVLHPDVFRDPMKAAEASGYSISAVKGRAHAMRQRLMRFIRPQEDRRLAKLEINRQRVEEELAAIGFADVSEYQERIDIEMADGGYQTVTVWKHPDTLTVDQRRAIKSIVYGWTTNANDEQVQSDRPTQIVLYSKDKALHELAGLFGDMGPKNPADEQQTLFDNLETSEREELVRLYQIAARRAAGKTLKSEGTDVEPTPVPRIEETSPRSDPEARVDNGGGKGARDKPDNSRQPAPARRVRPPRPVRGDSGRAGSRDGNPDDDTPRPVTRRAAPRKAPVTIDAGDDSDVGYRDLPS